MSGTLIQFVWLILYWYYVEQNGAMQKGIGRRIVAFLITGFALAAAMYVGMPAAGWLLAALVCFLFDLFFDEESIRSQWWKVLLPGLALAAVSNLLTGLLPVVNGAVFFCFFCLLALKRGYLGFRSGCTVAMMQTGLSFLIWLLFAGKISFQEIRADGMLSGLLLLQILVFFLVEGTLFSYKKSFEHRTESFQREILSHQYEEIKSIYMDMRGWRHDYHNHLQVMKAQMATGNFEELSRYLDELEQDLDRVDTYVKSGNMMVDAILNSKLSLAEKQQAAVNCKAQVPEQIPVEDVDLCVILGNLLDNALEACGKIEPEKRFIRIYMVVNKSQLYLSVQNSAKEELDFDERHYITHKRGNHGFGMRRVKALVDKYEGYLNLANEPGIFAAEVTMPLVLQAEPTPLESIS